MKCFLFFVFCFLFSGYSLGSIDSIESMNRNIMADVSGIRNSIRNFDPASIPLTFSSGEWDFYIERKCGWVRDNANYDLWGQEDRLSYALCLKNEYELLYNEIIRIDSGSGFDSSEYQVIDSHYLDASSDESNRIFLFPNMLSLNFFQKYCKLIDKYYSSCVNYFYFNGFISNEYPANISGLHGLIESPSSNKTFDYLFEREIDYYFTDYSDGYFLITIGDNSTGYLELKNDAGWIHCGYIGLCVNHVNLDVFDLDKKYLNDFNEQEKDISFFYFLLALYPLTPASVNCYNNIAYYLERESHFESAVYLLERITMKFPSRVVAYINLGDAYWGLKKHADARAAYRTYIRLMRESNREQRIPQRVVERIGE